MTLSAGAAFNAEVDKIAKASLRALVIMRESGMATEVAKFLGELRRALIAEGFSHPEAVQIVTNYKLK